MVEPDHCLGEWTDCVARDQLQAQQGVRAHECELLLVQPAGLLQNGRGQRELADVVQQQPDAELRELGIDPLI